MLATLRQRNFALLWIAGLISVAGDFALVAALPLHAYALTGSAIATGGVIAAALLPRVVLGSMAGVLVDRWDRRWTMMAADLLRAMTLLPLLAMGSADALWLLYLVRFATSTLTLFFNPAESALLPRLVGKERLVTANALNALNDNLGRLVGPALGGVVYATSGLGVVVLADATTFLVSALCIAAIRIPTPQERIAVDPAPTTGGRRFFQEWRAGIEVIRRDRTLSVIFLAVSVGVLGEGTFAVGFVPLVVRVLDGGAEAVGLLLSAQAMGGIVAGVAIARMAARVTPRLLFAGGLVGIGLTDLGLAHAATLTPPGLSPVNLAAAWMLLGGIPSVAGLAAGRGLVQVRTADTFRGRVFGALDATYGVATLVGLALGGVAIAVVGVVPVLSIGAAMWIIGGILAWSRLSPGLVDAEAEPGSEPPSPA